MRKLFDKATALILCGVLVLAACGSDDGSNPADSDAEAPEITPEVVQLTGVLLQSFQTVFFAVLAGAETFEGEGGGSVEIDGAQWKLNDYSPDGILKLNGTLTVAVNPLLDPPSGPATGTVVITGVGTTTIDLDLNIQIVDGGLTSEGTITINDIEYDARTLFDAVSAAQAAAAAAAG